MRVRRCKRGAVCPPTAFGRPPEDIFEKKKGGRGLLGVDRAVAAGEGGFANGFTICGVCVAGERKILG